MSEAETKPAPDQSEPKNQFQTVTLGTPIKRGETNIDAVNLRKPKAGELRGLDMQAVLTSDVTATLKLIPRISDPILTDHEVNNLEADDFAELAGTIRGFFMTLSEKKAVEMMMAEHQPKT